MDRLDLIYIRTVIFFGTVVPLSRRIKKRIETSICERVSPGGNRLGDVSRCRKFQEVSSRRDDSKRRLA